ncbi:MAG: hypothetical protein JST89_03395 [Cyanobacteria bacterium SZAS-4]|nr:hypothetical protein [Cyanobacteria bacterium SZAS-4]
MLPKSGLACLFLLTCIGTTLPALSQAATDAGIARISAMETKIFAHPYNSEILPARVARLERFVYGSESKEPLEMRIERLTSHVKENSTANTNATPTSHIAAKSTANQTQVAAVKPAHQAAVNYPRVSEIEQQLLERTFESDSVLNRIERLEARVFGRVWTQQTDLALRVDRLGEYAYMNPEVEKLEQAELLRVSMLPHVVRNDVDQVRNVVYQAPAPKKVMLTVVDNIESLETMTFGKISASKPLSQRVDALEVILCGAAQTDKQQNLTARVALLLSKVNNALPNRLGV